MTAADETRYEMLGFFAGKGGFESRARACCHGTRRPEPGAAPKRRPRVTFGSACC
jgi:hypothetical protein